MKLVHRASLPALTAVALLAAAAPTAQAATPRCASLKGASLLKSGPVKVVDRTYRKADGRTGHRYVACPRDRTTSGSVKQLTLKASKAGGRLEILDGRGAVVAVRDAATRAVHVWNVGSRTRRRLENGGGNPSGRVLVGEAGEAAAVFGSRLVGFDYDGTSYVLDAGPVKASSLRHGSDSVIRWSSGSADLSEPAIPCAKMKGKEVATTPRLRITTIRYPSELLEGSLDGTTERYRACAFVNANGPVRNLGQSIFSNQVQGGAGVEVQAFDGPYVLTLEQTEDSGGDTNPRWLTLYDVAAGTEKRIWGNKDAGGPNAELGDATGYAISASGHTAVVFTVSTSGPDEEQVVGFYPDGRPRVLDRAPAPEIDEKATAMFGTVVEWTRNGQRRSADLAKP